MYLNTYQCGRLTVKNLVLVPILVKKVLFLQWESRIQEKGVIFFPDMSPRNFEKGKHFAYIYFHLGFHLFICYA